MIAFLYIDKPKTQHRFARHQHARIDDCAVIELLIFVYSRVSPSERLCLYSRAQFRSRWNALLAALGLPYKHKEEGATPGVLRGSGVTDFYIFTEDIPRAAWRGRWKTVSTLEYYLQEAAAQMFLSYLDDDVRQKIRFLSDSSDAIFYKCVTSDSPAAWRLRISSPPARRLTAKQRRKVKGIVSKISNYPYGGL